MNNKGYHKVSLDINIAHRLINRLSDEHYVGDWIASQLPECLQDLTVTELAYIIPKTELEEAQSIIAELTQKLNHLEDEAIGRRFAKEIFGVDYGTR